MVDAFVDRHYELDLLLNHLNVSANSGPRLSVIEGVSGMGKSAVISAVGEAFPAVTAGRGQFVRVQCYHQIGVSNAYGPILDALRRLQPTRRRRFLRGGMAMLEKHSSELALLIPGIGPLLSVGASVTRSAIGDGASPQVDGAPVAADIRHLVVMALLSHVRPEQPLLLAIDDAHRIDESSCAVIAEVAESAGIPIGVILAYRPEQARPGEPLRRLLEDLDTRGRLLRIRLSGLAAPAVGEYASRRFGVTPSAPALHWLLRLTGGQPIFFTQFLSLLAERNALDLLSADAAQGGVATDLSAVSKRWVPSGIEAVIQERLSSLDQKTLRLLRIAAVHGEWFMSGVIEKVSGLPREEVLELLNRVARDFGIIEFADAAPWISRTGSDFYVFEHALLHRSLYWQQSPQTRRDRHIAVADALVELIDSVPAAAPRSILLDAASHYHLGGHVIPAVTRTLDAARRIAAEGSSFAEASRLCQRALGDIRTISPKTPDTERLHVETIELLLVVTALSWRGRAELPGGLPLEDLADEAALAARQTGDPELESRALFMRGKTLLRVKGPTVALPQLKAAMELAADTTDPFAQFVTMAEYGHHLAKQDMHAGMAILLDAEQRRDAIPAQLRHDPVVMHVFDEVQCQLGVNFFDVGDFGAALARLDSCSESLRRRDRLEELSGAMNYLGQVYRALGQLDRAAQSLTEAISCNERSGADGGWYGWNLGLLAVVLAELGDTSEAITLAERAWRETERIWLANIVPVVRNYFAQVMLHTGDEARLPEAREMLVAARDEAHAAGLPRSEINALCGLGRLHLHYGDIEMAVTNARAAVDLSDRVGPMSTVRVEEILYHCAVAMRAAGDLATATMFTRAWEVVQRKAESIPDELTRNGFLTRVPLNQLIRRGFEEGA
jgi:tetratricopeptide (TPR) repeat protein